MDYPGVVTTLECPDCGAPMRFIRNSRFGNFYGCSRYPVCQNTHGAHPDGTPLGKPANKATREARIRAHAAFDRLWHGGRGSRGQAYSWMRKRLGLTREQAHIGLFDAEQCERLIALVEEHLKEDARDRT